MARVLILVLIIGLWVPISAHAIGIVTGGTDPSNFTYSYNTTAPSTPGWNYVGVVEQFSGGEASGVYLGNGWVLTAAHVGAGNFLLNGTTYYGIGSSAISNLTFDGQTADLTLFQISTRPNLPPLTLRSTDPTPMSTSSLGSSVTMIGYGGNHNETWGTNTVTFNNVSIAVSYTVNNVTYNPTSNDFVTITNAYTEGSVTSNNTAQVVGGDSGGGDFIYNSSTRIWELAGINEVNGTADVTDDNNVTTSYPISGMIQLDSYAAQINSIVNPPPSTDTPTLPLPALLLMALLLFLFASRAIRTNQGNVPNRD